MSVTTCAFKRRPPEKTASKSLRRRSRCFGLNRRSEDLRSGRESAPSLRTPCAEDSPTCLGRHPGSETVTTLALQVARLKSAFHRTAPTRRGSAKDSGRLAAEGSGIYRRLRAGVNSPLEFGGLARIPADAPERLFTMRFRRHFGAPEARSGGFRQRSRAWRELLVGSRFVWSSRATGIHCHVSSGKSP